MLFMSSDKYLPLPFLKFGRLFLSDLAFSILIEENFVRYPYFNLSIMLLYLFIKSGLGIYYFTLSGKSNKQDKKS